MFGIVPFNRRNHGVTARGHDMLNIDGILESFFNDSFLPVSYRNSGNMKVDIRENEKDYVVEAELPGIKKEDINLEVKDDKLTISVEKNEEKNEEKDNYIRKERRQISLCRSFYVDNIKNEDVTARYDNGILTIVLPKSEPGKPESKKIEIN